MNILVVDDDPVVLLSCRRVLEHAGIETVTAERVREALKILQKRCFSLLLVDIKMPEEDGLTLMHEARKQGCTIPVLVMSGYPTPETVEHSLTSGAKGFIAKPFTPNELLEAIHSIIEGEQNGE